MGCCTAKLANNKLLKYTHHERERERERGGERHSDRLANQTDPQFALQ